jgi:Fanconi anemia group M protein
MTTYIKHPLIKNDSIESRLYQQVLAGDVLKKGNTMVVAPTALGKTIVAILVAADRLQKVKNSKVLILSPSKPLAIQHEASFKEFLTLPCSSITGSVKTDERVKRWQESRIISATPQTVESDLLNGRYDLSNVSLIVFDECHHGVGAYSYVYLASRYVKESNYNLILGLTASPGSDKTKIEEVCKNLYIQNVVVKTENDRDVKPYFNPVEIDWVRIKMSEELDKINKSLEKALKIRLKTLKNMGIIKTISVTKVDILKARGRIQAEIARTTNPKKELFHSISILSAVINIQHAQELVETQGVHPFNKYIVRLRKKKTKASKSLMNDPNFSRAVRLAHNAEKNGWEHPKLRALAEILKKELGTGDGQTTLQTARYGDKKDKKTSKIIVFTQFRDTLEMIHQKLENEGIKSVKFFGQAAKDGEKGLTQKEQKEIIKSFRMGEYDVLISTSVAEEGIDIPAVDLVVLYEPVPSEVRMIQRRGRTGRKRTGRVKVLITNGTRDEGYYWSSVRKEDSMKNQLIDSKVLKELNESAVARMENEKKVKVIDKPKEENLPLVYADSREGNSNVIRYLSQMDMDVKIHSMAVADYQVSDEVAIERKTARDFVSSMIDKRLFKQARELSEEFKRPLMILEGDDLYSGMVNPNAIRGTIASIALDFGISIIPTRDAQDTAAMIKRIAIREQNGEKTNIQIRTDKKPVSLWEQQLFIVESLPSIGPVNAKNLLEHFGSVSNVFNASESELMEVEGIGKITAQNIRKVIESKYLYFKKEVKEKKLL